MIKLNDHILKTIGEDITKKAVPAINEPALVKEFISYLQMQNDFLANNDAYEVANTLRSFEKWYKNKLTEPKEKFIKPREVYYVDLGAFNLKYEEGFLHSCMVLKRHATSLIVIPGSTKSYGKNNPFIFDVEAGNGFRENTGLQLDQIRCVSSIRLGGKLRHGKVSPETFNDITNRILQLFFPIKNHELNQMNSQIGSLNTILEEIKKENENLKRENEELKKENEDYKLVTNEWNDE